MYDMTTVTLIHHQQDMVLAATTLFNKFERNNTLHRLGGWLGRANRLLDLNHVRQAQPVRGSHYRGQQTVPIAAIRGSEGRADEFDAGFRPLSDRSRERWVALATAILRGVVLPPVELIEVAGTYYVRDGHHRISVARALGQHVIDAEVTVWEVGELHQQHHAA